MKFLAQFVSTVVLIGFVRVAAPAQEASPAAEPLPRTAAEIDRLLRETAQDRNVVRRSEAATSAPPPQGDPAALARFLYNRGFAARRLGRYDEARRDLEETISLAAPGSGLQVLALLTLRDVQGGMGDARASEATYRRVLETVPGSGAALYALASFIRDQTGTSDLRGARATAAALEETYRKLVAAAPSSQFVPVWKSNYDAGRAQLAWVEGRYAEAADAYRSALGELQRHRKLFDTLNANIVIERGWHFGADVLQARLMGTVRDQNRFVEAEALGREALVTAARTFGSQSTRVADALMTVSVTVFMQGRYGDATTLADWALERYRASGNERVSSRVLAPMERKGQYLAHQERWAEVEAAFAERAQLIAQNPDFRKLAGPDNAYWAIALARLGRADRAVPMARRIVEARARRFDPGDERIAMARGLYGIVLARSGNRAGALREFREALPVLLNNEQARESEEGVAVPRVQQLRWILEEYLGLLTPGGDAAARDEAFRISDIARGSGVQRALAAVAARESFSNPELTALARGEQDLANRVRAANELLANVLERGGDLTTVNDLRAEIDTARAARRKLRAEIAARFPDYAQLLDPKPLSLAETGALLEEGEALVSIYAAEDRTYVWALRRGKETAFAVVPLNAAQIAQRVTRLRRALDPGDVDSGSFPAFDVGLAHELYRTLLGPVQGIIDGATHLIVVPHGSLGQINFALLVTAPGAPAAGAVPFEGYRSVSWLARKTAVSQLPSVSSLAALRKLPAPPADRVAFAGFGDPAYGGTQSGTAATRGVQLRSARLASDRSVVNADRTNQLAKLAQLPDTREEIEEIARALHSDPVRDVRLGAAANETAVRTANLSNHRVIAFATHGLVPGDLEGLSEPALALSNPKVTGERDADGLLTLGEILALKLNADWVVLSACNTGAAEGEGSEAVSGLGRGFFFAGARALLVSNWPVETVSAKLLTTGVFRHQTETSKLSRAEALRRSMLDVLDRGTAIDAGANPVYSYAHPLFWAPFSLVGDGR